MDLFQDYMKIEEVATLWNVTPRRVQALCAAGKIKGAARFDREWMIPKDTPKPIDGRTKAGKYLTGGKALKEGMFSLELRDADG